MISVDALVTAIQGAVEGANAQLQQQSDALLQQFFVPVSDNQDEQPSNSVGSTGQASSAIPSADSQANHTRLRPRYVTMEYPTETANGLETLLVDVPLISMVPVVSSRIKEVTFNTALEVSHNEQGDVEVAFPSASHGLFSRDKTPGHLANLEIKITGDETPEGLQKLIEGYNRVLRAQIPG